MIDRETLHRTIDTVMKITNEKILPELKPGGDVLPSLFVLDDTGLIAQVRGLVTTPGVSARDVGAQLEEMLRSLAVPGYIVQWMGWIAPRGYTTEQMARGDYQRPSEDPERIEVLNITAGSPDATAFRCYEVKRDYKQRLRRLEERADMRDQVKASIFHDMLGKKGSLH
jgi:hypothetical protein